MYKSCLFCHADLGSNEEIECFPVGTRLAFDAAKGRLWVVCRQCERWNLTPLEERWEAIEDAERRFRATRTRVSTDHIGLAHLSSGLELVRVGAALRPELAAWRYGDQFGRRRRRYLMHTGAAAAVGVGFLVAGPATGLLAGGSWGLFNLANTAWSMYQERRVRTRLVVPGAATPLLLRRKHLSAARLVGSSGDGGWALRVSYDAGKTPRMRPAHDVAALPAIGKLGEEIELTGNVALRAAGKILTHINEYGAKADAVQRAVRTLEEQPDPIGVFSAVVRRHRTRPLDTTIDALPVSTRLALEMAAHEESERRAMEGELALLEAAWQEAEEIAAIADDMFPPAAPTDRR